MNQDLTVFLSSLLPIAGSLITAVVGLIVVALKYKKQKYEIAILEEKNKFIAAQEGLLSDEEISEIKAILKEVRK